MSSDLLDSIAGDEVFAELLSAVEARIGQLDHDEILRFRQRYEIIPPSPQDGGYETCVERFIYECLNLRHQRDFARQQQKAACASDHNVNSPAKDAGEKARGRPGRPKKRFALREPHVNILGRINNEILTGPQIADSLAMSINTARKLIKDLVDRRYIKSDSDKGGYVLLALGRNALERNAEANQGNSR